MFRIKPRTLIGLVVSIFAIGSSIWTNFNSENGFLSLGLNEQGDFLAGFIAPLALIWLVIGYLQQGEELKSNTDALLAQKDEFNAQNLSMKK